MLSFQNPLSIFPDLFIWVISHSLIKILIHITEIFFYGMALFLYYYCFTLYHFPTVFSGKYTGPHRQSESHDVHPNILGLVLSSIGATARNRQGFGVKMDFLNDSFFINMG